MTAIKTQKEARDIFSAALYVAKILLENGAEISRVEETINRILSLTGYEEKEAYVTPTSIWITLRDSKTETITTLKRVVPRDGNLSRVSLANDIARKLCSNEINAEEATIELKKIENKKVIPEWLLAITLTFLPAAFYLFFEGINFAEICVCVGCGIWITITQLFLIPKNYSFRFFKTLIISIGIAIISFVSISILKGEQDLNIIIISSIMPLVPGVPITTAMRDFFHGDYQSGIMRTIESFMIALSVALGIGLGLFVCKIFF